MLNLEVYGYHDTDTDEWATFMRRLGDVFSDAPYRMDIKVTHINSRVVDLNMRSRPFIRLMSKRSGSNDLDAIKRLTKLGMDIEDTQPLFNFFPTEST